MMQTISIDYLFNLFKNIYIYVQYMLTSEKTLQHKALQFQFSFTV